MKEPGTLRRADVLGDFTTTTGVLPITGLAVIIGAMAAVVAALLLKLIGFFTNLFFYGRFSFAFSSPAAHHLGVFVIAVPVAGALIVGVMARYGSEKIRGHGIPEALEAVLMHEARVEPRVAVLKPLSSAISIGSGGPFGAEGPIIMTGAALGSLVAQFFHLTTAERKTLLAAGAAAGMSATFAAPVASLILAVELLLFELKPRSIIPVAMASVVAGALRRHLIGVGPVFPVPVHPLVIGADGLFASALVGILAGGLAVLLTLAVYAAEDGFHRLPIHWMWWPAIGGVIIGVGGYIFPQALGVGYDVIATLTSGDAPIRLIVGVLVVKSVIWSASLGSGTSGGVLAPLLMIGAALGALEGHFLPWEGAGFWPLISMGATLAATIGAPLTSVVFVLELTHDVNVLLPLLSAVTLAYGFTVLTMKRSILTEKISRRGYHLSREYSIDPLEIVLAKEVMQTSRAAIDSVAADAGGGTRPVGYPDEPLRVLAFRMAEASLTRLAIVSRKDGTTLGAVGLADLLSARTRVLDSEQVRSRTLGMRIRMPRPPRRRSA